MTTRTMWAALVVIGATAAFNAGCSAHARVNGGEPSTPSSSSTTTSSAKPTSGGDEGQTGSTSQASTSTAASPSSSTSTEPSADPPKSDPPKSEPPGHADVPGVGNQRKAEGAQPGQVGKGLTKHDVKPAEKKTVVAKKDDKKPAHKKK